MDDRQTQEQLVYMTLSKLRDEMGEVKLAILETNAHLKAIKNIVIPIILVSMGVNNPELWRLINQQGAKSQSVEVAPSKIFPVIGDAVPQPPVTRAVWHN